jgi:hypothetical protein
MLIKSETQRLANRRLLPARSADRPTLRPLRRFPWRPKGAMRRHGFHRGVSFLQAEHQCSGRCRRASVGYARFFGQLDLPLRPELKRAC